MVPLRNLMARAKPLWRPTMKASPTVGVGNEGKFRPEALPQQREMYSKGHRFTAMNEVPEETVKIFIQKHLKLLAETANRLPSGPPPGRTTTGQLDTPTYCCEGTG